MGQYHSVINLDKASGYSPRSIGSYMKLLEQSQSATPCAALLILLSDPNGWGGERIAVVGDYAEDGDLPTADPFPASELFHRVMRSDAMKNVGWLARKVLCESGVVSEFENLAWGRDYHRYEPVFGEPSDPDGAPQVVVVNHDRREMLSPRLMGDAGTLLETAADCYDGGTGTALYLLLAAANKGGARGDGDLRSESSLVGSWAGDRISVVPESEVPEAWADVSVPVRDVLTAASEGRYLMSDHGQVRRVACV